MLHVKLPQHLALVPQILRKTMTRPSACLCNCNVVATVSKPCVSVCSAQGPIESAPMTAFMQYCQLLRVCHARRARLQVADMPVAFSDGKEVERDLACEV